MSQSVCSTVYPRPTIFATSPVRIPANFFHEPDECWFEPSSEYASFASGVLYTGVPRAASRSNIVTSTEPTTCAAPAELAYDTKLRSGSLTPALPNVTSTKPPGPPGTASFSAASTEPSSVVFAPSLAATAAAAAGFWVAATAGVAAAVAAAAVAAAGTTPPGRCGSAPRCRAATSPSGGRLGRLGGGLSGNSVDA